MPGVYPSYCGLKLLRAFFYSPLNGMLVHRWVHRWVHRQQYFHIRGKKNAMTGSGLPPQILGMEPYVMATAKMCLHQVFVGKV